MYVKLNVISLIFIYSIHVSYSSSICSTYYSSYSQCECKDEFYNDEIYVSLKCIGYSTIPNLLSNINYDTIEIDYCSNDLNFNNQILFENLTLNVLRIRHCNLAYINDETFSNMKQIEKFYLENSTIKHLSTSNSDLQDIFASNSFHSLKTLALKHIHYNHVKQKLNLELLLKQLPNLYRLELSHIHLDNYRYYEIHSIGQHLTYLSLTNTYQTSLLPIQYLISLERLLIRHLPEIFQTQPLISSLKNLHKLKYILFEHNQIKTIEHLRSNTIDDIDLSSNSIEYIDEYTFEHVPKLRQLTLSNNPLNKIDRNAFCGIQKLERLSINIKHRHISPLDNCFLINYPKLQIVQDSETKLQCNCQLMNIIHLTNQPSTDINRLFKQHQICVFINDTSQREINLYELENNINCSKENVCFSQLCQERKKNPTIKSLNEVSLKSSSKSLFTFNFSIITIIIINMICAHL